MWVLHGGGRPTPAGRPLLATSRILHRRGRAQDWPFPAEQKAGLKGSGRTDRHCDGGAPVANGTTAPTLRGLSVEWWWSADMELAPGARDRDGVL